MKAAGLVNTNDGSVAEAGTAPQQQPAATVLEIPPQNAVKS